MEDHDRLIRIDERTEQMIKDIGNLTVCVQNYDVRIGNLESWKSKTIGIAVTFPIIIPILFYLVVGY